MKILDLETSLKEENALLKKTIQELSSHLKIALEQIDWLKKQLFGKKSERFVSNDDQPSLPGLEGTFHEEPAEERMPVSAHEKRKAKSSPLNSISFPEDLPVEEVILDLPEEEKVDPITGKNLVCIGSDISKKLGKKPASYFIKQITRRKYALPGNPDEGIKMADLPDSIIGRSAVDESIIADILTKKFCDHLPLYRQAEMLLRDKISVSRQTLASYVVQAGKALKPLYDLLTEEIKKSGNIFVDETPIDMLAPGRGKTVQGYMTVMAGGQSLNPGLRVYTFLTSRKHEGFEKLLKGYSGVFHSDKYQAYEKEAKKQGKTWCPCYAHIRRKFVEAGEDPPFQKEILLLLQELFSIEEKSRDLAPEQRIQMRVEEAVPIIDTLLQKAKERLSKRLLPRSNIGKAIGYLLGLSPYLKNYIQNPYARLDNNVAERALKLVVIGRKNWMFVGNQQGGEASAVIYSLAQTCRALQINPQDYFDDVLRRIQGHPYNKLVELLPQNWKKA